MPAVYRVIGEKLPFALKNVLIDNNERSVVVTGRRRQHLLSAQVGKTALMLAEALPLIDVKGKELEYINIGCGAIFVPRGNVFSMLEANMKECVPLLKKPADVFVLNEAFQLFGEPLNPVYMLRMRPHIESVWKAAWDAADRGSKFIFVSALHPMNRVFRSCEVCRGAWLFTEAPVIEFAPHSFMSGLARWFGSISSPSGMEH